VKCIASVPLVKMFLSPVNSVGIDDSEIIKPYKPDEILHNFYHPPMEIDEQEETPSLPSASASAAGTQNSQPHRTNSHLLVTVEEFKSNLVKIQKSAMALDDVRPSQFFFLSNGIRGCLTLSFFLSEQKNTHVTFLGTGSAIPSKYRNVSSTYLMVDNQGILFDAGEGTYGQLYRRYGDQISKARLSNPKLDSSSLNSTKFFLLPFFPICIAHIVPVIKILETLKCVFVSHMHADHHLGLVKILTRRKKVRPSLTYRRPFASQRWPYLTNPVPFFTAIPRFVARDGGGTEPIQLLAPRVSANRRGY